MVFGRDRPSPCSRSRISARIPIRPTVADGITEDIITRAVMLAAFPGHRPQLDRFLQGEARRRSAGGAGAGRALLPAGQHAPRWSFIPHLRAARRFEFGHAALGAAIRSRLRRFLRRPGRDHQPASSKASSRSSAARSCAAHCASIPTISTVGTTPSARWRASMAPFRICMNMQAPTPPRPEACCRRQSSSIRPRPMPIRCWRCRTSMMLSPAGRRIRHGSWRRPCSAARRAVELDDDDWLAHALLGIGLLWVNRQYDRAQHEVERAIALNPSAVIAHQFSGCVAVFRRAASGGTAAFGDRPATGSALPVPFPDPGRPLSGTASARRYGWRGGRRERSGSPRARQRSRLSSACRRARASGTESRGAETLSGSCCSCSPICPTPICGRPIRSACRSIWRSSPRDFSGQDGIAASRWRRQVSRRATCAPAA